MMVNPRTGRTGEEVVTNVRYRKFGSKGRFETFVVAKKMPRDHQKLVDAYIAAVEKVREETSQRLKKARAKMRKP